MAKKIDPKELVSIARIAKEYGYHPNYLSRLASEGKIQAWRVGNSWATTRIVLDQYVKLGRNSKNAGRIRGGTKKNKQ